MHDDDLDKTVCCILLCLKVDKFILVNLQSKYSGKSETSLFSNFDMATVLSSPIEQGLTRRFISKVLWHDCSAFFFIAPYCAKQILWCKWMRFSVNSVAKYFITRIRIRLR